MKKIISLIVLIIMVFSTVVYAADSFSLKLIPNVTTANPGQTITVSVRLADLNITGGDQGVGGYQAKVVYDEDKLEFKGISSETWEVDDNEGNILANTKDGEVVKEEVETATLTFQVKETAEEGKAKIELQEIEGAIPDTIEGTSNSIEIEIKNKVVTPGGEIKDPSNGGDKTPSQTKDNTTNNRAGGKTPSTTSTKELPKTGGTLYVVPIIMILVITGAIGFIQYRKYRGIK